MNQITVHQPLKGELDAVVQPVELIDESGRRLGHFVPVRTDPLFDNCPYTPAELKQMQSEPGARSLKEIWTSF